MSGHERRRKTEKRVGEEKKWGQRIGEVDPSLKNGFTDDPFLKSKRGSTK